MVLGTYKEAVAARSTDKRIQEVAQDGGIASALPVSYTHLTLPTNSRV